MDYNTSQITVLAPFVTRRTIMQPHACNALRKVLFTRARFMKSRARRASAAPVGGVRGARCASLASCAWWRSPRPPGCCCSPPIKERAYPASSGMRISRSSHATAGFCFTAPLLLPQSLVLPLLLLSSPSLLSSLPRRCLSLVATDSNNSNIRAGSKGKKSYSGKYSVKVILELI